MTVPSDRQVVPYVKPSRRPGSGGARIGAGAPWKVPRDELVALLWDYVEQSAYPSIAGFAYSVGYHRGAVYEIPELAEGLRMLITKKEMILEFGLVTGTIKAAAAILALKQIGWRDRPKDDEPERESGALVVSISGGLPAEPDKK